MSCCSYFPNVASMFYYDDWIGKASIFLISKPSCKLQSNALDFSQLICASIYFFQYQSGEGFTTLGELSPLQNQCKYHFDLRAFPFSLCLHLHIDPTPYSSNNNKSLFEYFISNPILDSYFIDFEKQERQQCERLAAT